MNFKRIALFAVAWFVLQIALMMGAVYVLFAYKGEALFAEAESATVDHYNSLMDAGVSVATFLVYLLFLRVLRSRLMLHALALFMSLEILQILLAIAVAYTANAVTWEDTLGNLLDWLPVELKDLAIALLAVGTVFLFRKYKSRKALAEPRQEDRT